MTRLIDLLLPVFPGVSIMAQASFRIVTILGTLCGIGYYVLCLWSSRRFLRQRAVSDMAFAPPVSILKPLSGADPQAYENLRSHCLQDYPEFEIIFGVSDPDDSAVPVVNRLITELRDRRIRLIICSQILGTNLKVSNLVQMLPCAKHEFLLVNDSDIRVTRDYLSKVIAPFSNPAVGMVTCLYRGISGATLGSRLEAAAISATFCGNVLAARQVEGGIHFGLGSTLVFSRTTLASIGGFEPLLDYLADDFELGHRMARAGRQVWLSNVVVDHYLPDYSFWDFLRHQLRWSRSTRASRPWGYLGLVLTFGIQWAILAAIASGGAVWGWALLAAAAGLRTMLALVLGLKVLKDRQVLRRFWLIPLSDLAALIVWIGGYTGQRVFWRGNEFILEDGKLRPA
ncbi:MAG TPA: bacteriohopanetetrol glucosamine biosynthesis glycosyltransferase HpnI [Acidobacteriota bacterium]